MWVLQAGLTQFVSLQDLLRFERTSKEELPGKLGFRAAGGFYLRLFTFTYLPISLHFVPFTVYNIRGFHKLRRQLAIMPLYCKIIKKQFMKYVRMYLKLELE